MKEHEHPCQIPARLPPAVKSRSVRARQQGHSGWREQSRASLRRGRRRATIHRPRSRRYLYDIDGHSYIDYIGSWGPMILGHVHPQVRRAVVEALDMGSSFGAPTVREIEIAETVVEAVPSIEKVRFVSSGTEAAMSAVRVARGVTGRSKIVKMTGHYHGHIDCLLVQAGSAATTLGMPNSPGVTEGAVHDTILCPFNDAKAVSEILTRFPGEVAAVLLEPIAGNMGLVPPLPGYLAALRELTEKDGCLLVFDEVMTGFRVAYGGAQALFGITPDLTALGKIVGGGLPAAAYGASAAIMDHVSPVGPIYPGGHAFRKSPRHGRWPDDAAATSRFARHTIDWRPSPPGWQTGSAAPQRMPECPMSSSAPAACSPCSSMMAPYMITKTLAAATPGCSPGSSGKCWLAAFICRAASSRLPSFRRPTPMTTSIRRSRRPPRP